MDENARTVVNALGQLPDWLFPNQVPQNQLSKPNFSPDIQQAAVDWSLGAPGSNPSEHLAQRGQGLYHSGDDPMGEIHSELGQKPDAMQMAMAIMGGPRALRLGPRGSMGYHSIYNGDQPIATMRVANENPRDLWVENIGAHKSKILQEGTGAPAASDPNSIGPGSLRSIIPQLKEMYPEAERIGGWRITGARDKAGSTGTAWLRLRPPEDAGALNTAADDAMRRWWDKTIDVGGDMRSSAHAIKRNMNEDVAAYDLVKRLQNPDVTEMTARRNVMQGGQPNWSEVSPIDKQDARHDAAVFGAAPNTGNQAITQDMSDAVRNRWLGAQQRQMRRDRNNEVQTQMGGDERNMQVLNQVMQAQRAMAEALKGSGAP